MFKEIIDDVWQRDDHHIESFAKVRQNVDNNRQRALRNQKAC
jgi:hypothetical protein